MIKEAYVSFEVAKLLKEKGFREITLDSYRANGQLRGEYKSCNIPCPTHQMALAWLREVHNKHCDIGYDIDLKWFFQIIDLEETIEYPEPIDYHYNNDSGFKTYEEAVEAALKYCLEELI